MVAAVSAAGVVAGAVVAVVLLTSGGGPGRPASPGSGSYTATGPWRIRVDGTNYGGGCILKLQNTTLRAPFDLSEEPLYSVARYQVPQAGKFTWTTTDRSCLVTALPGVVKTTLPFFWEEYGDTDLFTAPPNGIKVTIVNNFGSSCTLRLYNSAGQELDTAEWEPGDAADQLLHPSGAKLVFVDDDNCQIRLAAQT